MKLSTTARILTLATLALLVLPSMIPLHTTTTPATVMASYNPPPASNFHAPLSIVSVIGLSNSTPSAQLVSSISSYSHHVSTLQTIRQNGVRFINDSSYFPQSETTIAVDPNNPNHVVGGFNDEKYFFCGVLPVDCGSSVPASLSGFTTSIDGGKTVQKSNDLPAVIVPEITPETSGVLGAEVLTAWGDPSLAPTVDGNFFYASLAINPFSSIIGNGVMIAKSNTNLFNPNNSCKTPLATPWANPCWTARFINGQTSFPVFSLEDKDRIAVDRDPTSAYYGYVYIGWDHFTASGISNSDLARCDPNLTSCVMLSTDLNPVSGQDPFVAWTTPTVDKYGNVYLAWCNFGTYVTLGPVTCKMASSAPGGTGFGTAFTILSYMGQGTTLPNDTLVIGWATEQFRSADGLISIATDQSPKSNNIYFTTNLCTSGHYYAISAAYLPVAEDNPGDCGQSAVIFSESTDNGQAWSQPITLSNPSVNDQPYVTVDPQLGTVYVVYYTAQYDPFNHRIDVVASISNNAGHTFHQQRITSVSDEPNSDPNMFNYIVGNGFGGSFAVPQYGDYFEATAHNGTLYVLFTGNYAVEQGTFQTDPFLSVESEQ